MSWLYTNPYISPESRSAITYYGASQSHGYDTLFRPHFSTYNPTSYRAGVSNHFNYNNPTYHLFGELEHYSNGMPAGLPVTRLGPKYYNIPADVSDSSSIDVLEKEMNNFIANINNPHNAYNNNKPLYYPRYMSHYPDRTYTPPNLTQFRDLYPPSLLPNIPPTRMYPIPVPERTYEVGTFEDNRKTPYAYSGDEIKPVDYERLMAYEPSSLNRRTLYPDPIGGMLNSSSINVPPPNSNRNNDKKADTPRRSVRDDNQSKMSDEKPNRRGSVNEPPPQQQRQSIVPNKRKPSEREDEQIERIQQNLNKPRPSQAQTGGAPAGRQSIQGGASRQSQQLNRKPSVQRKN